MGEHTPMATVPQPSIHSGLHRRRADHEENEQRRLLSRHATRQTRLLRDQRGADYRERKGHAGERNQPAFLPAARAERTEGASILSMDSQPMEADERGI